MDFTLSDEQKLMVDSLRKAYETSYAFDQRSAVLGDTVTFHSPTMWQDLVDNGFVGLLASERIGGFGGGGTDIMAVTVEMSRHLALEPFLATSVMGIRALERFGSTFHKNNILPKVISGEANLAVALYEPGQRYELAPMLSSAEAYSEGYLLNGSKAVVVGADSADWIIVGAKVKNDDPAVFLVNADADGLIRKPYRLIDGRGAADIEFTNMEITEGNRMGGDNAEFPLYEIEDWAIMTSLAETLGAMEKARDLTHQYLQTREQFGRPIGTFQVLQHSLVDVLTDVEFTRSMVYLAASEVTNIDAKARRKAISGAKAFVDSAARNVAERCVQMHGGIGVTDEYALSHYVKRMTLGQVLFGDKDEHLLRYADTMA